MIGNSVSWGMLRLCVVDLHFKVKNFVFFELTIHFQTVGGIVPQVGKYVIEFSVRHFFLHIQKCIGFHNFNFVTVRELRQKILRLTISSGVRSVWEAQESFR